MYEYRVFDCSDGVDPARARGAVGYAGVAEASYRLLLRGDMGRA